MQVEELYFEDNSFGKLIQEWAMTFNVTTHSAESKSIMDINLVDGLVLFHENHDISKHHHELIELFEARQKGISRIDVNGTLSVAKSNFELWLDRNRSKRILVVGDDGLSKNVNTPRFLNEIKLV